MAQPIFIDFNPPVVDAAFLNSVGTAIWQAIGDGTNPPTTPSQVKTNLGIPLVIGDVTGPVTSTTDRIASFADGSGKVIEDSGVLVTEVVVGPAIAVNNNLASFNLTTGKLMKDSGILSTNVVTNVGTSTDNAAARFDLATGKIIQNSPLVIADTTGSLSRVSNGGIPVQGTNTNDNAAAGYLGEVVSSTVVMGSAVGLTTNIPANVTSISITAGDWDISGVVQFTQNATTSISVTQGATSTTSASLGTTYNSNYTAPIVATTTATLWALPTPTTRISVASTTTVYLVAVASFTISTMAAYGVISARRSR